MNQKPEIGKILRCDECQQEKIIRAATLHEEKGWIRFCLECFHSVFSKYLEESREIALKPEEFCLKHNKPKKIWKKGADGMYKSHCFACDQEEWINSLEHLHSEPLKIAKFFYQKGADTWPTIQRLVYFAYVQSIKQKKMLFEEKFEIWEGNNPILISLYEKSTKGIYPLSPTTVLKDIEEPIELFIKNILTEVYQNFDYYEEEKRKLDLALNELLELAKEEELDLGKIYPWQFKEKEKYILSYAS